VQYCLLESLATDTRIINAARNGNKGELYIPATFAKDKMVQYKMNWLSIGTQFR